jgi:hypothetical protein
MGTGTSGATNFHNESGMSRNLASIPPVDHRRHVSSISRIGSKSALAAPPSPVRYCVPVRSWGRCARLCAHVLPPCGRPWYLDLLVASLVCASSSALHSNRSGDAAKDDGADAAAPKLQVELSAVKGSPLPLCDVMVLRVTGQLGHDLSPIRGARARVGGSAGARSGSARPFRRGSGRPEPTPPGRRLTLGIGKPDGIPNHLRGWARLGGKA